MKKNKFILFLLVLLFAYGNSFAAGDKYLKLRTAFKEYFNDMKVEVMEAKTPAEKREIISSRLKKVNMILDKAEELTAETKEDKEFIAGIKEDVNNKLAELEGTNGYEKVSNSNLNEFATYVQQDMEMADTLITISLTTALLILIIILLIA